MSRPEKALRSGRPKRPRMNRFHYFRPVKDKLENDSDFVKKIANNPEVIKEINAYAKKVSADLSIIPESNLFPVLYQVIFHSVKTGYEIARQGKFKNKE